MISPNADLLKQIKQGDDLAFTSIVEQYQAPVYNLCYRMMGNQQEAEDASQETFWRVYQGISKYDPARSFSTWILSIAAHYCIDQLRRRRVQEFSMDILPEGNIPDMLPNPEVFVSQSMEHKRLHQLLSALKPDDRIMIILRYWYDFSDQEISDALRITTSAVKSRMHRAKKSLATLWLLSEKKLSSPQEMK